MCTIIQAGFTAFNFLCKLSEGDYKVQELEDLGCVVGQSLFSVNRHEHGGGTKCSLFRGGYSFPCPLHRNVYYATVSYFLR